MTENLEAIKTQILSFPLGERIELAHFILLSLEPEGDEGIPAAWEAEVARRVDEIQAGKAVGKPADQLLAELREQYP